jgi:hypothetical protein
MAVASGTALAEGLARRTRRSRLIPVLLAVAIGPAASLLVTQSALAVGYSCGSDGGFHWAGITTALEETATQCVLPRYYYGWSGLDGELTIPSAWEPLPDGTIDHAIGAIGAYFSNGSWFNMGWFTGTITDSPRVLHSETAYHYYAEDLPTIAGSQLVASSGAALGSSTTDRVVYNSSSGCWQSYIGYPGTMILDDCEYVGNAAMIAEIEAGSHVGGFVQVEPARFGSTNPDTNEALRLHGSAGYEPWDTSLVAEHTDRFDEHSYVPAYVESDYEAHFYFEAYSN